MHYIIMSYQSRIPGIADKLLWSRSYALCTDPFQLHNVYLLKIPLEVDIFWGLLKCILLYIHFNILQNTMQCLTKP